MQLEVLIVCFMFLQVGATAALLVYHAKLEARLDALEVSLQELLTSMRTTLQTPTSSPPVVDKWGYAATRAAE